MMPKITKINKKSDVSTVTQLSIGTNDGSDAWYAPIENGLPNDAKRKLIKTGDEIPEGYVQVPY